MRIEIIQDARRPLRWHGELRRRLAALPASERDASGREVRIRRSETGHAGFSPPPSLTALLLLDRTLAGHARESLADTVSSEGQHAGGAVAAADLVINLTSAPAPGSGPAAEQAPRILTPLFDGIPGEAALWSALLNGRGPELSLMDSLGAEPSALLRPALETPHHLLASADAVLSHLIGLIVRRVATVERHSEQRQMKGKIDAATRPGRSDAATAAAVTFLGRRLADKAGRVIARLTRSTPKWQVGWRHTGQRMLPHAAAARFRFRPLPDDGHRYYADPFAFERNGIVHVFVEELPYATGRGIVSHFTIGADGTASRPMPVLEPAHHLSYPQVFEHDGDIYMLPEASASGRLTLYRADPFPARWVPQAILIDEPLHDATLFARDGEFWIAANTVEGLSSTWDTLALFSAPGLAGPWTAHPHNPVLVDLSRARPAGALFAADGTLWRPAQDCSAGYGGALALNRINRLDAKTFAEEQVATLHCAGLGPGSGPHTLNFAHGIELIDLFAPRLATGTTNVEVVLAPCAP
ncbi:MAG: hypothetical protein AB7E80_17065 [Hyphomicrobiaceae bacterium]